MAPGTVYGHLEDFYLHEWGCKVTGRIHTGRSSVRGIPRLGGEVPVPLRIRHQADSLLDDDPGGVRFEPIREPGEDEGHDGGRLPAGLGERLEVGPDEALEADHVLRSAKAGEIGEGRSQHGVNDGGRERQAIRQLHDLGIVQLKAVWVELHAAPRQAPAVRGGPPIGLGSGVIRGGWWQF